MGETYYDVLGVHPDATRDEIAAAYRRRALEVHPDRNDAPDATEQFTRLQTAESVLSDERERARYDRLGHEGYVRLARLSNGAGRESDREDAAGRTGASAASGDSTSETGDGAAASGTSRRRSRRDHHRSGTRSGRRNRTGDRNRSARRTATDRRGDERERAAGERRRAASERRRASDGARARDASADPGAASSATFRYAVHGWTGEVELDPRTRQLDRHTALVVACIATLYPAFVYASLAPAFPLPVNVFLAACTLVFVGYLLTMPRIALATFGGWSLLVPLALVELPAFDPFSPHGLLALAFILIPFGYAVAVRWALRP